MNKVRIVRKTKHCHNPRCDRGGTFEPKRRDQKHCDSLCKERCLLCRRKYNPRRNEKMRLLRRERRHVA